MCICLGAPLLAGGLSCYTDIMKTVDIKATLLEKYTNGELIHFISSHLNSVCNVLQRDPTPDNLLRQFGAILQASEYLKSVDERMNGGDKKTPTVL